VKSIFASAAKAGGAAGEIESTGDGWVFVEAGGQRRGWAGTLEADRPAWAAPLLGFELELHVRDHEAIRYTPVATTPPVERDVALILPREITAAGVEAAIRGAGGDLLEDAVLFDEYRSDQLSGRSVAWRLVFRSPNRTLRDKEVDNAVKRILSELKEQFGVERRET
jgi:phenylalanyl-tRNA synthetase beta subunit